MLNPGGTFVPLVADEHSGELGKSSQRYDLCWPFLGCPGRGHVRFEAVLKADTIAMNRKRVTRIKKFYGRITYGDVSDCVGLVAGLGLDVEVVLLSKKSGTLDGCVVADS